MRWELVVPASGLLSTCWLAMNSVYKDPTGLTQEGAKPLEANKKLTFKTRIIQKTLEVQLSIFPFLIRLESAGLAKRQPYSYLQCRDARSTTVPTYPSVLPDPNSHSTGKG